MKRRSVAPLARNLAARTFRARGRFDEPTTATWLALTPSWCSSTEVSASDVVYRQTGARAIGVPIISVRDLTRARRACSSGLNSIEFASRSEPAAWSIDQREIDRVVHRAVAEIAMSYFRRS